MKTLARTLLNVGKVWARLRMYLYRSLFNSCGRNVGFDPSCRFTYDTISIGDDVAMSYGINLLSSGSRIEIGNKVMIGPEVILLGGDHNTTEVGRFMRDVTEKKLSDDLPITIEDDVWIGARAIILKGVTVGRGAIIGAGSVVGTSIPPYAIALGYPARVVRFRWDIDTILRHEELLYPPEKRMSREQLVQSRM